MKQVNFTGLLREQHRLRGMFGLKRVEVTASWRKLNNDFYDQVSEDTMGIVRSTHGENRNGGKVRRKETTRKTWTW
jgi:hypothetical protein